MGTKYSIHEINRRIDESLEKAKRLEYIVIGMSLTVFLLGVIMLAVGFWFEKNVAIGFGAFIDAMIAWPINKLIGIREQNIKLGIIPALSLTIDNEEEQVKILQKLIDKI